METANRKAYIVSASQNITRVPTDVMGKRWWGIELHLKQISLINPFPELVPSCGADSDLVD